MRVFYFIGIALFRLGFFLAASFHAKAKRWQQGRKNLFPELEKAFAENKPTLWFHCASLGEFEQGRPLMEEIRKTHPHYRILLTFFSPSGYEVRKNYAGADYVCYMPSDTPAHARRFLAITKPVAAFFVKYEFWYFHLEALSNHNIPHFLVSGIFRRDQPFFKGYGNWFRKALQGYNMIFTQDEQSLQLVNSVPGVKAMFSGDTRFDRVLQITAAAKEIPLAGAFADGHRVIVAGSSWPPDEELLVQFLQTNSTVKLLIAPHETAEEKITAVITRLRKCSTLKNPEAIVRFSQADTTRAAAARVLVIDNVGMLSSLYRYGQIACIGGGFGAGIHNTLEAAVWGMPVLFGPHFEKFNEAKALLKIGAAFTYTNSETFAKQLSNLLEDPEKLKTASEKARTFVQNNAGATERIIQQLIQKEILK